LNSLHDFSSWLSIMFFCHDSLSKSNNLHVFSSWLFIKQSSCFSSYFLSCFSSCFSLCFSLYFSLWLSIKQSLCFFFMTFYQKDNAKVGKISIFNSLDVKLEFLMSQVKLTQFSVKSSHVKLKICITQFKLSWKCKQLNFESSWIQNINLKLDLMISLWTLKDKWHFEL